MVLAGANCHKIHDVCVCTFSEKEKSSVTSCLPVGFVFTEYRTTFDFFYEKEKTTLRKTSNMIELGAF